MIDVVYPLGSRSRFHNHEIRFSLRSLERYLKNIRRIYIIGEHHRDLQNVWFIPSPDPTSVSDTNIMHKMTHACRVPEISEDFLMVHDDHYLLTDFDAPTFPYFFNSTIEHFLTRREPDSYHRRVKNTGEYLKSKGLPDKFFDIHTPIIFNKLKFLSLVTSGPDWTLPNMYVVKSIYANSLGIEGVQMSDHKAEAPPPPDARIFSTAPRVKGTVQRFLLERFPMKSKYEKTDF